MIKNTDILEPLVLSKCSLDSPIMNFLTFNRNDHKVTKNEYLTSDDKIFNYQQICSCTQPNIKLKRVDYALEKPNVDPLDYIYCLTAHSSYW